MYSETPTFPLSSPFPTPLPTLPQDTSLNHLDTRSVSPPFWEERSHEARNIQGCCAGAWLQLGTDLNPGYFTHRILGSLFLLQGLCLHEENWSALIPLRGSLFRQEEETPCLHQITNSMSHLQPYPNLPLFQTLKVSEKDCDSVWIKSCWPITKVKLQQNDMVGMAKQQLLKGREMLVSRETTFWQIQTDANHPCILEFDF